MILNWVSHRGVLRLGKLLVDKELLTLEHYRRLLELQAGGGAELTVDSVSGSLVDNGHVSREQLSSVCTGEALKSLELGVLILTTCSRCGMNALLPEFDFRMKVTCPDCHGDMKDTLAMAPVEEVDFSSLSDTASATSDTPPPEKKSKGLGIRRYVFKEELGRGRCGVVLRAFDVDLQRFVALRLVETKERGAPWADRLLREARSAARLEHPGIVQIYDAGLCETRLYIAMQLLRGETLASRIREGLPIDSKGSQRIMAEVAKGLQAAHEAGVVHRNITPANIMLVKDGGVRIMDFGLAVVADTGVPRQDGEVSDALSYTPPEQWGGRPVDARGDLYQLGIVFYELLAGQKPYTAATVREMRDLHLGGAAAPVNKIKPDLPQALALIVRKLMARDPAKRYPSAEDFLKDLSSYQKEGRSKASAQTRRGVRCRFCEAVNPSGSRVCAVCRESLESPSAPLALAVRKDEFRCPACKAFVRKGARECGCGKQFCRKCKLREAVHKGYCGPCYEAMPEKMRRKLR